jgi:hypothetical protein
MNSEICIQYIIIPHNTHNIRHVYGAKIGVFYIECMILMLNKYNIKIYFL